MSQGGKRPGAGAPKGNLNAVKSGQFSKRIMGSLKSGSSQAFDALLEKQAAVQKQRSSSGSSAG